MERNQPLHDAPIPGMSLTHEVGARPWQSPPQYASVDEAIEYYMSRMSSDEFVDQLVDIMEMGIPLTTLANTIQMSGVMDGKHTIDVGILVLPVLIEMMMLIGDTQKVEYDSGLENPNKGKTRSSTLAKVKSKLKKKMKSNSDKPEAVEEPELMLEENETEEPKGLMARR
jgi:hypothetical protein